MSVAPRLVLATRNAGKLRELAPLIRNAGFSPVTLREIGLDEQPEEDALESHPTFAANALAKAHFFFERCGGDPVLAEDSGLCVTALGGAPGVRSKRWWQESGLSGVALDRHNVEQLLAAVEGASDRSAKFVCAATLVWSGGLVSAEGETAGRLLDARCGESGFGYDAIFWSDDLGHCFGAVTTAEKGSVSHRRRAVQAVMLRYGAASRTDLIDAS